METHSTSSDRSKRRDEGPKRGRHSSPSGRVVKAPAALIEVPLAVVEGRSHVPPLAVAAAVSVAFLVFVGVVAFSAHAQDSFRQAPAPVQATHDVTAINPLWYYVSIILLTLVNGAFSMAETALVSVRRSRVAQLEEEGRRGATTVRKLVENPPRFIATTQVGITLLGFASAAAAATTLADPLVAPIEALFHFSNVGTAHTIAVVVVTLGVSLLTMVLGEIAPKSLAVQAPDLWALRLAPFVTLCAILFKPLTYLVVSLSTLIVRPFGAQARFETPFITREEFQHMISSGEKHGEIDEDETTIIKNVFDLSETPVRSVMTPRIDMTMLSLDATLEQTLEIILVSGHSRIPVYEVSVDHIVGIVHAKDLLPLFRADKHDVDLRTVMRDPYFVPETTRVSDLLEDFRHSNQQLAIVQDEYTGTAGLVTLEDLLEEIVGDIRDEYDVDEPEIEDISDSVKVIDGRLGIDDVNDHLSTDLPHDDYDTIGGLVFSMLGNDPVPGDRVQLDGIEFVVEKIEGRRISSLRATRQLPMKPVGAAESSQSHT